MSSISSRTAYTPTEERGAHPVEGGPGGWVMFAGVMLAILGILNFIYGIAAVDKANFYVRDTQYVISDLKTWGWAMMAIGAVQFAAACALLVSGSAWARWIGIASAGLNAIGQLLYVSSYPWLTLALFAVDVLVLYGLIAHGGRRATA